MGKRGRNFRDEKWSQWSCSDVVMSFVWWWWCTVASTSAPMAKSLKILQHWRTLCFLHFFIFLFIWCWTKVNKCVCLSVSVVKFLLLEWSDTVCTFLYTVLLSVFISKDSKKWERERETKVLWGASDANEWGCFVMVVMVVMTKRWWSLRKWKGEKLKDKSVVLKRTLEDFFLVMLLKIALHLNFFSFCSRVGREKVGTCFLLAPILCILCCNLSVPLMKGTCVRTINVCTWVF